MNENTVELGIRGARAKVEVVGVHGVFYRVRQGGEVLKRRKGKWEIALKGGGTAKLRARGWVPGFQSLWVDGDRVYRFGTDVPAIAKWLAFLPLTLIAFSAFVGGIIGILLVFYSLSAIKVPGFPRPLRIALPVMNTIGGLLIIALVTHGLRLGGY